MNAGSRHLLGGAQLRSGRSCTRKLPPAPDWGTKKLVFNGFSQGRGVKIVKYAPLGVQMAITWVGLVGFVRGLVTRCLVFQCTGGLKLAAKQ